MQFWFFLDFAFRDLFKSKVMFSLIIMSIALTTIAILSTSSILLGFSKALENGNNGWLADLVISSNDKDREEIIQTKSLLHYIRSQPNVLAVTSRSYATGALRQNDKWVLPMQVIGVNVDEERLVSRFHQQVVEGRFLKNGGPTDEIVLGLDMANSLAGGPYDDKRVHAGEFVLLRNDIGDIKKYRIVGVIDAKTFSPNAMVFLEKDEVENFLMGTKNTELVIRMVDQDPGKIAVSQKEFQKMYPKLLVQTSEESAGFVKDILSAVSYIVAIINTLLIFVVFFIVNIVMYISVSQDKRQIGILKSIGCTNKFIVTLNIFKAVLFGLLAYSLGLFVYVVLYGYSSQNPYPLLIGDFKMGIDSSQMVFSLVLILSGVLFGSFIPSMIAAKTNIIDVLRESD